MKLMLVEDSQTMRKIIKVTINMAGFRDMVIQEAGDGLEALRMIEQDCPDVLLTDLAMPNLSGTELIREIVKRKYPIKCGYITAVKDTQKLMEAQQAGALFYLPKPFTTEQLQRVFRVFLSLKSDIPNL